MKYIFIAGLIGWLLGMSMKNICLAALGIPTLYGLVVGFFFSRWAEQNHTLAYGIACGLYAAVVLIWLIAFIRSFRTKPLSGSSNGRKNSDSSKNSNAGK